MSHVEIMMRLLSAEASVPLENLRSEQMRDDDWTKIANVMTRVSEVPSTSMIRRTCRWQTSVPGSPSEAATRSAVDYHRLSAVYELRPPGRVTAVEVSEFSRQIKLITKELGVPIVALSQTEPRS